MLLPSFFDRDACAVARGLIGKVIRRRAEGNWLSVRITETEAYYAAERASHASLGRTPSREALFAAPGVIYMYHSRAGASFNVSVRGEGNAVLVKAGLLAHAPATASHAERWMSMRNRVRTSGAARPLHRLCAGQTLLCASLDIHIADWNGRSFNADALYIEDDHYRPEAVIVARRLGIPEGRDEHLMYRYLDAHLLQSVTDNPLSKRKYEEGRDYWVLGEGVDDMNPSHLPLLKANTKER